MPETQEIQTRRPSRPKEVLSLLDSSLDKRRDLWAYSLLALGFLIRIWHASGTFLDRHEHVRRLVARVLDDDRRPY